MIRTQIYLQEDQYKKIKLISSTHNKPQSEVIRDALDKGISELTSHSVAKALLEMASSAIETDDPNLSLNIDKHLYEQNDRS